ncbi:MAG: rhomboid family intramembrane serine protease [Pseudobdellovibrionaceae bacterium]
MLNVPPVTKIILGLILGIEAIFSLSDIFLPTLHLHETVLYYGAFIPTHWTNLADFSWTEPLTLISFTLLHGGWLHTGVNTIMLMALGSGVERNLGAKRFLILFWGSSFIAALTHLAFSPFSDMPVVGASGGIGGLFGVLLILMRQHRYGDNPLQGLIPVIMIFILISALTGLMGAPDGSSVAWVAHIGGFLGGIGLFLYGERHRRRH